MTHPVRGSQHALSTHARRALNDQTAHTFPRNRIANGRNGPSVTRLRLAASRCALCCCGLSWCVCLDHSTVLTTTVTCALPISTTEFVMRISVVAFFFRSPYLSGHRQHRRHVMGASWTRHRHVMGGSDSDSGVGGPRTGPRVGGARWKGEK